MDKDDSTLEDVLRRAAAAVDAASLPDDLRAVAFGKAVDLISGAATDTDPATTVVVARGDVGQGSNHPNLPSDKLGAIASKLQIEKRFVEETFHIGDDGEVNLSIASTMLSPVEALAQQEVALLVAAARQGSAVEEWTPSSTIREVADDYGKMNHHFAENVAELDDEFSFKGKGKSRSFRLKIRGWERAGELVKRLQGVEPA